MSSGLLVAVCGMLFAGCGRVGFEPPGGARDDAAGDSDADLAAVCGPRYAAVPGLTSRYRVELASLTWYEAERDCESDGGHLVVIDDAVEDAWVSSQIVGWIGYTDQRVEGEFVWITDGSSGYTNWNPVEPTNSGFTEDCAEVRDDLQWKDSPCGVDREYVCECDGVTIPTPPVWWCETQTDLNCDFCGDVCPGGTTCANNQSCVDPS